MTSNENQEFEILQNITFETIRELSPILDCDLECTSDLIDFAEKIKNSLFYNFFLDFDFPKF